ncbi:hypothetical protein QAD02_016588 [Eretmocerus hayati]|uniref:Uncharacterized protein n=1 Tax=Eretmocerus hayati TaxID=131215 RepID=A0ACC2PDB7_9HYME|nr:hypothetical protein QAD02_016588 [Eretmocerus hayati]
MSDKYLQELKLKVRSKIDLNRLDDDGENILHKAIKQSGKVEVIKFLVSKGADIHATTRYGSTVLHLAIQNLKKGNFPASLKLVTYLLENSVDVKFKDNAANSALHCLIKKSININQSNLLADYLLKAGAIINTCNKQKQTPLHIAVESGNHQLCDYLVSNGADPSCKNKKSKTPLQISVEKSNVGIVKLLIHASIQLDKDIEDEDVSLLHIAIKSTRQGNLLITHA